MRVGFTGSREYPRPDLVENFVGALANKYPEAVVISGGRGAVDETAEKTGDRAGVEVVSFRPVKVQGGYTARLWTTYPGKPESLYETQIDCGLETTFARACFARNGLIVKSAQRIVGFWDLESRGTADTLSKARGAGKPRVVYGPDGMSLGDEAAIDAHVHRVLS